MSMLGAIYLDLGTLIEIRIGIIGRKNIKEDTMKAICAWGAGSDVLIYMIDKVLDGGSIGLTIKEAEDLGAQLIKAVGEARHQQQDNRNRADQQDSVFVDSGIRS